MIDVKELFEKHNEEFLKFDRIEEPLVDAPDLCAMLYMTNFLTTEQCECHHNIILYSEHDEIFFSIDVDYFSEIASEFDVIYLIRCGVRYSENFSSFCMFT